MATQTRYQHLSPQARQEMSACLGALLTEINLIGGGTASSAGHGGEDEMTGNKPARASSRGGTRGGSHAQHVQAGHEGGIATARKRGRKSNAERAAAAAQS